MKKDSRGRRRKVDQINQRQGDCYEEYKITANDYFTFLEINFVQSIRCLYFAINSDYFLLGCWNFHIQAKSLQKEVSFSNKLSSLTVNIYYLI